MDLRVDSADVQALVTKSLVDALSPEAREKLISNAIVQALTATEPDFRGRRPRSPLQQAFDEAVVTCANRYASEMLSNDPQFREQLEGLFADVSRRLFDKDNREALVDAMASTIRAALTKDRY